jgi:hypothetical protein
MTPLLLPEQFGVCRIVIPDDGRLSTPDRT